MGGITGILQIFDDRTKSENTRLVCGFIGVSVFIVAVGLLVEVNAVYILFAVLTPLYVAVNMLMNIRLGSRGLDKDEPYEIKTIMCQRHRSVYIVKVVEDDTEEHERI